MESILKISEIVQQEDIIDLKAETKAAALDEMLAVINKSDLITDKNKFSQAIKDREKLMSTGIGYGIAVPHARDETVKDFVIAIGRSKKGIKYESIDDKPVHLIFMIGASDKQDKDYIKLLARIVLRLKNKKLRMKIINATNSHEIYSIINNSK